MPGELIYRSDALRAVARNLDRLNGVANGTMDGVAEKWLEDVETVDKQEVDEKTSGRL